MYITRFTDHVRSIHVILICCTCPPRMPCHAHVQETSEPLHTCPSLSVSSSLTFFFLAGHFTQILFHAFLHKAQHVHTTFGQNLHTRNSYGSLNMPCSTMLHISGSPPTIMIICLVVHFREHHAYLMPSM